MLMSIKLQLTVMNNLPIILSYSLSLSHSLSFSLSDTLFLSHTHTLYLTLYPYRFISSLFFLVWFVSSLRPVIEKCSYSVYRKVRNNKFSINVMLSREKNKNQTGFYSHRKHPSGTQTLVLFCSAVDTN